LATDGVTRGVIGPREPARIWTRHVLNGAAVAEFIEHESRIVDVGTGAGLPGIPLAIARPDCRVDLLEPLERRVRFLHEAVAGLQLRNCRVIRARAENAVRQCGEADVVTSRAVAPLSRLAGWCAPLLRSGGVFLALKGASAAAELERDRAALAAAGLVDPAVLVIAVPGAPPTTVVRAVRAPAGPGRARRAGGGRSNNSSSSA
jgi:16S rRNA (guanine527-N7)-methyltransferase